MMSEIIVLLKLSNWDYILLRSVKILYSILNLLASKIWVLFKYKLNGNALSRRIESRFWDATTSEGARTLLW